MKQMRRYYPALAAVAFLLSGCGQKDAVYDYGPEKMTAMIEQIPDERLQAPSFASALCVIMGDEPEPDSTVTAKAAGVFSLKDGEVLIQKNPYERMNPASITKIMTALIAVRDGDLEIGYCGTGNSDYRAGSISLPHCAWRYFDDGAAALRSDASLWK